MSNLKIGWIDSDDIENTQESDVGKWIYRCTNCPLIVEYTAGNSERTVWRCPECKAKHEWEEHTHSYYGHYKRRYIWEENLHFFILRKCEEYKSKYGKKSRIYGFFKRLEYMFDKNRGHDYRYGRYLFKRLEYMFDKSICEDYRYEEYLKCKNKH